MKNHSVEVMSATKCADEGVFESFSTSIPIVFGHYWYWSPYANDFVVAEAILHKGKMKLKINNEIQAEMDDGGFIHSKIEKPTARKGKTAAVHK